ncbi:MAG: Uncharacterized protein G01um101413_270 [Parcubacteria group bacterium Gr01-1014_13]|nr:MAG: Uncharacterized protein G01um101413_270 [Parcubacteria group bacterium Gr01-1014_13]
MKLSPSALKTIHDYFNLPFIGVSGVRCPYFNNARLGQRGQLKVLIGKGTPEEIVEEAKIVSIQYRANVFDKNGVFNAHVDHPAQHEQAECIRQFLVDNNLGVDCSGFVTNVLQKHFQETKGIDFVKKLFVTSKKNFLRWIISRLRPVEQISVAVYANNKNTSVINDLKTVQPGDLVVALKTGPNKNYNHILLVEEIDGNKIKYAHARTWSSEGKYGHGVSQGTITITNPKKGLLEQVWEEKNKTGEDNETYLEAKQAEVLEIRRIKL